MLINYFESFTSWRFNLIFWSFVKKLRLDSWHLMIGRQNCEVNSGLRGNFYICSCLLLKIKITIENLLDFFTFFENKEPFSTTVKRDSFTNCTKECSGFYGKWLKKKPPTYLHSKSITHIYLKNTDPKFWQVIFPLAPKMTSSLLFRIVFPPKMRIKWTRKTIYQLFTIWKYSFWPRAKVLKLVQWGPSFF